MAQKHRHVQQYENSLSQIIALTYYFLTTSGKEKSNLICTVWQPNVYHPHPSQKAMDSSATET